MVPPTGLTPDIRVTVSVAVSSRPPPENLHALEMQRAPRFIIRDEFRFGGFR